MDHVSEKIRKYVEAEILPRYAASAGHSVSHIHQVISRSFKFLDGLNDPDLSYDMAYVVAAYHDLGREIDDDTHEKISAQILLEDKNLAEFFSLDELKIMAEAVEDHRASNKNTPRSIYGKIVSSADRNTKPDVMIRRVFEFTRDRNKGTFEEDAELSRLKLRKKYGGADGYAAQKIYFEDPDFEACLTKMEKITRTPEVFLAELKKLGLS